jgi:hypothetical protein
MAGIDEYIQLNVELVKALQTGDLETASRKCDQLEAIIPDHPNVVEFRRILSGVASAGAAHPAQGEVEEDAESASDSDGGEESNSGEEDEDDNDLLDMPPPVARVGAGRPTPMAASARGNTLPSTTGGGAQGKGAPARTYTDEDMAAEGITDEEIDKMFAGSEAEAAKVLQRYGIMQGGGPR